MTRSSFRVVRLLAKRFHPQVWPSRDSSHSRRPRPRFVALPRAALVRQRPEAGNGCPRSNQWFHWGPPCALGLDGRSAKSSLCGTNGPARNGFLSVRAVMRVQHALSVGGTCYWLFIRSRERLSIPLLWTLSHIRQQG